MVRELSPANCFAVAIFLVLLFSTNSAHDVPNPFNPGEFDTEELYFSPQQDGCPLYSTMYYPSKPGLYTPILFLGGLYDIIRTEIYSVFLEDIASHGYIVIGIDLVPDPNTTSPTQAPNGNGTFNSEVLQNSLGESVFVKQIDWLKGHIDHLTQAQPNWEKLTLSCQSASCTNILYIVRNQPSLAAAAVFLDPVCMFSSKFKPVKSRTKALSYVSYKSFQFPFCCMKGSGYKRVYNLMTNVKVRMSVRDFGHCGLMDTSPWKLCRETHICRVGDPAKVREYKLFTAGMIHAFLQWTLDRDYRYRRYVTDRSLMPLVLNDLAYRTHPHQSQGLDMYQNFAEEEYLRRVVL